MTHFVARYAADPNLNTEWCQFVVGGADADIHIDNDGEMGNTQILVDLSHALSVRLGKQMSQMSVYRVSHIGIRLVNQNDDDDNDSAAAFGGRIHWYTPTKHRMDAMKIARTLERKSESIEIDADSFLLTTESDYTGMRFDWDSGSFAGHTRHATSETFSALSGSFWDLDELFELYGSMIEEVGGNKANYLWYEGRCGGTDALGWSASYRNSSDDSESMYDPESSPFSMTFPTPIEVLSGMLTIDVIDSSTDTPFGFGSDDDYLVEVTVGIEGWSDF